MFIAAVFKEPKLETTHMSFNGWTFTETVVHPYHGILLSYQKENLSVHVTTWINL